MNLKTDVQSGTHTLVTTQIKDIYAIAGLEQKTGNIIVKVVNSSDHTISVPITFKGITHTGNLLVTTLSNADDKAENTLDKPDVVIPAERGMKIGGDNRFAHDFPANSLTVLRFLTNQ